MKYAERISQSKEQKSEAEIASQVAQAKLIVEGAINNAKQKSIENQQAYDYALGTNPFNVALVLEAQQEKDKNAAKLAALNRILTEQF